MRGKGLAALAAVVALTAGCNGVRPQVLSQPTPTPTAVALSAEQVAMSSGCVTYEATPPAELELFVLEGGTCTLPGGGTVVVRRFGTPEAEANFWKAAAAWGTTEDLSLTVGLIALTPDDPADLATIRAAR